MNYDVKGDEKTIYKQKHKFTPDAHFRMLIILPSGSSKTNLLLDLIYRLLYRDNIYLFARNLHQSKYQSLIKTFEPISNEAGYDIIEASNDKIIPLNEMTDSKQKLYIFNGFLNTGYDREIRDYFTNSRNKNCSRVYLSQSWINTDKTMGINASHCFIFRISKY